MMALGEHPNLTGPSEIGACRAARCNDRRPLPARLSWLPAQAAALLADATRRCLASAPGARPGAHAVGLTRPQLNVQLKGAVRV